MATTAQFTIGAEVSCTDGVCGEVRRVVVDPVAEAVTHLVVGPKHREDEGRLVPLDLVDATTGEIRLSCTKEQFESLDAAEDVQFVQGTGDFAGYGAGQVGFWPFYGLGGGPGLGIGGGSAVSPYITEGTPPHTEVTDTVPLGEVEIRRGDPVHAADGDIGKVQGLVIDRGSRHVTHVLLQEGHLWGRKDVAIPISAVASTSEGIRLSITKQEVQDLPAVDIDNPAGLS
jgi:sporulation protein YlmC with PRC-barrel domain